MNSRRRTAKGTIVKHWRVFSPPTVLLCVCVRECAHVCAQPSGFIATGRVISWKSFYRCWLTIQPASQPARMGCWCGLVLYSAIKPHRLERHSAARWPLRQRRAETKPQRRQWQKTQPVRNVTRLFRLALAAQTAS